MSSQHIRSGAPNWATLVPEFWVMSQLVTLPSAWQCLSCLSSVLEGGTVCLQLLRLLWELQEGAPCWPLLPLPLVGLVLSIAARAAGAPGALQPPQKGPLSGLQVAAVREGMSWIVPVPLLSLLTAKQLEQMVCGMPEISVDVLKKVVRYREVDEQHQLVQWFWRTLEEFSNEERVLFMRFVSGRSRLPANAADISQRFQIMKVDRVRRWFPSPLLF